MFRTCVHFFLIVFILLWKECDPLYIRPETQERMKEKILHMDLELVKDVMMKIKAVQPFKDMYSKSPGFQAGQILFYVKSLVRSMNDIYFMTHHNVTNIDIPTKQWNIKWSVNNLFKVDKACMEIHVLVDMMEQYELRNNKYVIHDQMNILRRSGRQEDNDYTVMQMRAFHANLEEKKGRKKNKPGRWHSGR